MLNQEVYHEDVGVCGGLPPCILAAALAKGEWPASCSGRITSGETALVSVRDVVARRCTLTAAWKVTTLVLPVARHCAVLC